MYKPTYERKIDVQVLVLLAKGFAEEYRHTAVAGLSANQIQISHDNLEEVAPLAEWELNVPRNDNEYPYGHQITVDGVQFYAISADPIEARS